MATDEKKTYPKITEKNWWMIWKKSNESPSISFNPKFISSYCDIAEKSARDNVFTPFKKMGILNDDGKLTERGQRWRIRDDYQNECQEILKELYPENLVHAIEGKSDNRDKLLNWFKKETSGGDNVASQMTATYILLHGSIPDEGINSNEKKKTIPSKKNDNPKRKSATKSDSGIMIEEPNDRITNNEIQTEITDSIKNNKSLMPNLHIDMHVHIAPELTLEQIEKVFESMAKHLYQNKSN